MTVKAQNIPGAHALLNEEDVLPALFNWRRQGLRTALVTLVGVDGGAPRQPGAQMAVAEDGRYAGYLSGGCLEQAVALEAQAVISAGQNKTVRYGKDSPYFDIKLPCGSGLDLYFDQALDDTVCSQLEQLRQDGQSFALETHLQTGASCVTPVTLASIPNSSLRDGKFTRVYPAPIQVAIIGDGPSVGGLARLADVAGLKLNVWTRDDTTRRQLAADGLSAGQGEDELQSIISSLGPTGAAIVVFHDHEAEPRIIEKLLRTPAFYIGILGNQAVHRTRLAALKEMGVPEDQLTRLSAPVGSIPNAKSKVTFAFGVLSQLLAAAKSRNFVS